MTIFDFFSKKECRKADEFKKRVIRERQRDIKTLQKINKRLKLVANGGSIEIVIKNIQGVIEEIDQ
jgi:hypothetical protein